jgi:Nucleoside-diphosphate-sugar pyrophosphorylase involved in lipopolysaccharide biosynthesis/translation initiation factor 2B, gamma/epsilon subunits (eIF-2Bgamma/eIF-2Bepsilon)
VNEDWSVAVLAGGLATRLRPLTDRMPKALIKVSGEPFLAHQLRLLRSQGVRQVVLCLGYLGEKIKEEFGNGSQYDMKIDYSFDGPSLLGTGGALKRALPLLPREFFVLYGDSYLPISYAPVASAFRESGKPALMTVFRNENRWDTSNVQFDGKTIRRYDKKNRTKEMHYIDYGLGILRANVLATWPDNQPFELADVYRALAENKELAGFEVTQRFYEIGSKEGLAELAALFRESKA